MFSQTWSHFCLSTMTNNDTRTSIFSLFPQWENWRSETFSNKPKSKSLSAEGPEWGSQVSNSIAMSSVHASFIQGSVMEFGVPLSMVLFVKLPLCLIANCMSTQPKLWLYQWTKIFHLDSNQNISINNQQSSGNKHVIKNYINPVTQQIVLW